MQVPMFPFPNEGVLNAFMPPGASVAPAKANTKFSPALVPVGSNSTRISLRVAV
jgi:hypothetical protein